MRDLFPQLDDPRLHQRAVVEAAADTARERRKQPRKERDRRSDYRKLLDRLGLRRTGEHQPEHARVGLKGH